MLETTTQPMAEQDQGNTAYKRKDRVNRILLLSNMKNDIMLHFERHRSTQAVWNAAKVQYGGTFTIKLCQLTPKI